MITKKYVTDFFNIHVLKILRKLCLLHVSLHVDQLNR